jgi:inner membrane protein
MDPVAHTLFGAALAESGLRRTTRYATVTLLIGANLPDIDAVTMIAGFDTSLYHRRGLSHGILALVVLPVMLAGLVWVWHHRPGGKRAEGPPFRPVVILALAFLGVLSHLFLDWLNTYGIRLLMPFDDRWFYGDTLFIIDPWFWLLAAAGVVLARSARPPALIGWSLLGVLSSLVVLASDQVPTAVKVVWLVGVAVIVTLRWRTPSPAFTVRVARVGLATLVLYVGGAWGLARTVESRWAEIFPTATEIQAGPSPGRPHVHRLVVVEEDRYRIVQRDGTIETVARQRPDAVVRYALEDASIRGFSTWMRYPSWRVDRVGGGWDVRFYDLRYRAHGDDAEESGIGFARVHVPGDAIEHDAAGAGSQ